MEIFKDKYVKTDIAQWVFYLSQMYSYSILGEELAAQLVNCLVSVVEKYKEGKQDWQVNESCLL